MKEKMRWKREGGCHVRSKAGCARQILTTTRNKTHKTHKTWYGKVLQKVFKARRIVWDKEGLYTMMMGVIHQEDVAVWPQNMSEDRTLRELRTLSLLGKAN